jgi:hypothetical protein
MSDQPPGPTPEDPTPRTPTPEDPTSGYRPAPPERETVRVRRAPRLANFVIAGAIVGVIVALVLTFAFPLDGDFGAAQVFGFLLLASVPVFGVIGVAIALVLDRVSRRRAREAEIEIEHGRDDEPVD